MIGTQPNEVAEFLHSEARLNPSEVGDYLGENEKYAPLFLNILICLVNTLTPLGTSFVHILTYRQEG